MFIKKHKALGADYIFQRSTNTKKDKVTLQNVIIDKNHFSATYDKTNEHIASVLAKKISGAFVTRGPGPNAKGPIENGLLIENEFWVKSSGP